MSTRSGTIHDSVEVDVFELVREVERLGKGGHTGTDLYKQAIANVAGVPVEAVPDELRQVLKLAAFGSFGGVSRAQVSAYLDGLARRGAKAFWPPCNRCGDVVPADPEHVVLSCTDVLTPYTKRDQTTRVERRTHGLGRPQ